MGFFQNLFGKKTCALCGKECGLLKRDKIRNKEYLCSDCGNECSRYIRLSEYTLEEIRGHIEYMKKQERLYNEVYKPCPGKQLQPSTGMRYQGIEFCDELGMFRIVDKSDTYRGSKLHDIFRYDQVASYEPYIEKTTPSEQGEEPEIEECGMIIKLVGADGKNATVKPGTRPHPYVKREIKVCFSKLEESRYLINACQHFDGIFGVHDNRTALFSFGLSKEEKRNINAVKGAFDMFVGAAQAAKEGQLSEESMAKIESGANAIQDAQTGGLAVYTRRADEAEARIK